MSVRPYISNVRPYAWRDRTTDTTVPGFGLFKGGKLAFHLTEKEAVDLASQLLNLIEKERAR